MLTAATVRRRGLEQIARQVGVPVEDLVLEEASGSGNIPDDR